MDVPKDFLKGYLEAALWTAMKQETAESEIVSYDALRDIAIDELPESIVDSARNDCESFLCILSDAQVETLSQDFARAGMDFYLTRNRHGAGFWDSALWDKEDGKLFSAHSHTHGSWYLILFGNDPKDKEAWNVFE